MFKQLVSFFLFVFVLFLDASTQINYNFFISNAGRDSNPGTNRQLPKQTLTGSAVPLQKYAASHGNVIVGLKSGDVFNETFTPSYPVTVSAYADVSQKSDFVLFNGSDVFNTGWTLTDGATNTWQQSIKYSGFNGSGINSIGNYSFLYVTEIDQELEKTAPFTARKVLQFVKDSLLLEKTPGSFYEPMSNDNPVPVYIHTTDGSSPNNNAKYRYEVTVRDRAINAYFNKNNQFENLWVRGYGAGYGLLPGGANTKYNEVIFGPGAGIHHVVTKNASFTNCLFLPGIKNVSAFAVVFYDVEGFHRHNKVANSLFLDIPTPIYAHVSNGSNHGAVELDHVFAFGDSLGSGGLLSTSNTDSVTFNKVYADRQGGGYYYSSAGFANIKDSYFKDAVTGIAFQQNAYPVSAKISNVFIKTKSKNDVLGIGMQDKTTMSLTNSIVILGSENTAGRGRVGTFVANSGSATNYISAIGNIFICDVGASKTVMTATTNTDNGIATSNDRWSNNVYVLLRGSNMVWSVSNKGTSGGSTATIFSFSEWKKQSGQDKNSLFFDLRKDPRGLKAIFLDPDNGNFTLANTIEGNKIRALKAGMTTPLQCFLKKPTYEEAAEIIRSNKTMEVDDCRNPCQKTRLSVQPSFQMTSNGICANEEVFFTGKGNYLENDSYYHQTDSKARFLWWFADGKDTSGTNLNTVGHKFTNDSATNVRLQLVDNNGCSFDTTFTVKLRKSPAHTGLVKDTSLCTGGTVQLTLPDTDVRNKYTWSTGDSGVTSIAVTEVGNYSVEVRDNSGCKIWDTVTVVKKDPFTVSLGNDTAFCSSKPVLLTPVTSVAIQSYSWNTGATTDTLRTTGSGTYIVTAKDFGVCMVSDTIALADNPVNLFSLPADTTICEGTRFNLTIIPPAGTVVKWNDGVTGYKHTVLSGTTYSMVAENNGCVRKDTISIISQPFPVVKLGRDTSICTGYYLPLSVSSPNAKYEWSTGSNDSSIIVNRRDLYWVQATANGCSYRDSILITVHTCACNIEIPNAFSPNGDGVNDLLRVKMSCFPTQYDLSIFNRYGQVVFNTKDYNASWSGDFNGKPLAVGTYYYILIYNNEGSNNKPFTGSITLLR